MENIYEEFFNKENPYARQYLLARLLEVDRQRSYRFTSAEGKALVREYMRSVLKSGVGCSVNTCGNRTPQRHVATQEAARVREILRLYIEYGSLIPVVQELGRRGWKMKSWTTSEGRAAGGSPITKNKLHNMLTNMVHAGKVRYRGQVYAGEPRRPSKRPLDDETGAINLIGWKHVKERRRRTVHNARLAGPTPVALTFSRQRFKMTGTLASGQTGLWIEVRQYVGNGDDWTTGDIHLWGACLQQGDDPQATYARAWAAQTPHFASGVASGPIVIAAPDSTPSPLKIHGPGSNLADSTLIEITANGELILAGGSGNGYRFAEFGAANNPSGWSGVLRVKTPGGSTLGYVLPYAKP